MNFVGASRPLSEAGFKAAIDSIGITAAEMWAVLSVETAGCGFLNDRRPKILYESHLFYEMTKRRFPVSDINTVGACPYVGGAKEFDRLQRAMALDRIAALKCSSWGLGQILGENHALAGYPDVESMVAGMAGSEDAQLMAVCRFLLARKLDAALRAHDWSAFAKAYNGPGYTRYSYDSKLLRNHQKFSAGPMPDLKLREAQLIMSFLGYLPSSAVDGYSGSHTETALKQFQAARDLPACANLNDVTSESLRAALQSLPSPVAATP